MLETLAILSAVLLLVAIVLLIFLLRRQQGADAGNAGDSLLIIAALERTEKIVREEIARNRQEAGDAARMSREELSASLKSAVEMLITNLGEIGKLQKGHLDGFSDRLDKLTQSSDQRLETMRETIAQRLAAIHEETGKKLDQVRVESAASAQKAREEVAVSLTQFAEAMTRTLTEIGKLQKTQLDVFSERLDKLTQSSDQRLETMRETIAQRLAAIHEETGKKLDQVRVESAASAQKAREEVALSLQQFAQAMSSTLNEIGSSQRTQLGNVVEQLTRLTEAIEKRLEALRSAVDERLKQIQEDNGKQLEQMRATVDEKLQGTLEKRLGESFKQVSERLEQVHKGLGEMQVLATGVGDLKKVLTNVKSRGTWGEGHLRAMLEEVLTPDQFVENISTKGNDDRVEFAIRLPGRGEDRDEIVLLPLDAKFPMEDYQRLLEAHDRGDLEAAELAGRQLETRVKGCAWDIREKYLNPPKTTDFGILFLPVESLFAEVVRRQGLMDYVQHECRVVIAGPTTLWAILNSLQMGFRTLAIQKRSSEVWSLLAAVKTEWSKYGEVLEKVQKKLTEASNTIDDAQKRTRVIGRKLKGVTELPTGEAETLLQLGDATAVEEE